MTQSRYVGEAHPEGQAIYDGFLRSNPNLTWKREGQATLGGLLIASPGSRPVYRGQNRRWVINDPRAMGLDHMDFFYDRVANRYAMTSLPNANDRELDLYSGWMERLREELNRVNAAHAHSEPGKRNPREDLILYAGDMGTSWRLTGHPLVVVASNLVAVNLRLMPGMEAQP